MEKYRSDSFDRMTREALIEDFRSFCGGRQPTPALASEFAGSVVADRKWQRYGYPMDTPFTEVAGDLVAWLDGR